MCGVCGSVHFDGRQADVRLLERMTAALAHRGPDSRGVHVDGPAGLGATRLAILDLERGGQPMLAPGSAICIVHNGEIYNHAELRHELQARGHRFRTSGDTEVVLELYRRHGPDFAGRLRGMFATAIWDAAERRLVLARDRFGIKPLFYRVTAERVDFASELKSLMLMPDFSREVCTEALHAYLSQNSIPAPLTIFAEARKLEAGHVLVCERGQVTVSRYARPAPAPLARVRDEPEAELADELRDRLRDSVRAHLVSDVPVGVLLSGGVDSSTLTGIAAQETEGTLATFSIGFAEQSFSELENARLVASRYGTDHHELVVSPHASELLPELAAAFDEPFGDSSALPTYLVAQLAARDVKVVLSGEGSDELFGGYETYVADLLAGRLPAAVRWLAPLADAVPSSNGRVSVEYRAKRFLAAVEKAPLDRHLAWKEIFSERASQDLLQERWRTRCDPLAAQRRRFSETDGAPLLARLQDVDLGVYLVDDLLVKTDRMTMAHSLEARVPYLDADVAELALALPTRSKVRVWRKKRLLRAAASEWVPARILNGRKRGFSIPAAAWLRGELEPFAREVLAASELERQGFFRPGPVATLLDDHLGRRRDNSRQLWGLISFALWHDRVSRAAAPASPTAGVGAS